VVTTLHGIVQPDDVTDEFLARSYLPRHERIARTAFRAAYRLIDAASSAIIVHHEYFAKALSDNYGIDSRKIHVVPFGVEEVRSTTETISEHRRTALMFGFLTGYKLPEVVVDLAESDLMPDWSFRFCVGKNPRMSSDSYRDRYEALRARVENLEGSRAKWSGYVPEDELPAVFGEAEVLILPYTECLSGSAVANLARSYGIGVCYSRQLEPIFGESQAMFSLDESRSLSDAISFSATTRGSDTTTSPRWADACRRTEEIWTDALERYADRPDRA
jgi:glycosyltransferase involved in cell wall biosynthesis